MSTCASNNNSTNLNVNKYKVRNIKLMVSYGLVFSQNISKLLIIYNMYHYVQLMDGCFDLTEVKLVERNFKVIYYYSYLLCN